MSQLYSKHGLQFRYPPGWEVSEQREEGQVSITVSSPHTSFWTVTLLTDRPEPEDIVAAVLDAFEEEYEELDVYPSKARIGRRPTAARDIDFVCLELLNVARVRAFRTPDFTVMVLYQGTDGEFAESGPILERITKSLTFSSEPVMDIGDDTDVADE
ncbi:MAG TPA: hypothetical protein VL475_08035 [Planctomycetaceae bacterium]|nr:hypothetical protein [Planctomycetaceae bacterium]